MAHSFTLPICKKTKQLYLDTSFADGQPTQEKSCMVKTEDIDNANRRYPVEQPSILLWRKVYANKE